MTPTRRNGPQRPGGAKGKPGAAKKGSPQVKKGSTPAKKGQPHRKRTAPAPPPPPRVGEFRLGAVPGATPGKWISTWIDRYPTIRLELTPLTALDARRAVLDGDVDIAIAREPIDHEGLHVIALYEEVVGIVASVDSALEAADVVTVADLADEVLIVPADDVVGIGNIEGTHEPRFAPPATTEDAIATVATGVGIAVVPMSLARLHHRKDVVFRPLEGTDPAPVVLVWRRDEDSEDLQNFIGIVRGRTAQSSR